MFKLYAMNYLTILFLGYAILLIISLSGLIKNRNIETFGSFDFEDKVKELALTNLKKLEFQSDLSFWTLFTSSLVTFFIILMWVFQSYFSNFSNLPLLAKAGALIFNAPIIIYSWKIYQKSNTDKTLLFKELLSMQKKSQE